MAEPSATPQGAAKGRQRRSRRLRLIGVVALLLALPFALLAAGLAGLRSDSGLGLLRGQLAGTLSAASGYDVAIGSLSGDVFGAFQIGDVVLHDKDGPWLTIDKLDIAWRPGALLERRLEVSRLRLGKVTLRRQPLASAAATTESASSEIDLGAFSVPIDIDIDEASIATLLVAVPVVGQESRFSFESSLKLRKETQLRLQAKLDHLHEQPGRVSLSMGYDLMQGSFELDAQVFDAAGGLLATLLERPDLPASDLRLTGSGSLDGWKGRLSGALGSLLESDLAVTVAGPAPWRVTLGGQLGLGDLLPQDLRPLFGAPTVDSAVALHEEGRLQVERLAVVAGPATLKLSGWLDPELASLEIVGGLEIRDGRDLAAGRLPGGFASGQARFTASGAVAAPTIDLSVTLDDLAMQGLRSAHAAADLRLAASESGSDNFSVVGNGVLAEPDLENADLNRLIGGTLAWSLRGSLPLDGQAIDVAKFELDSPTMRIGGSGSLQSEPLAASAALTFRIPSIAQLLPPGTPAITGATEGEIEIALQAGTLDLWVAGAARDLDSGDEVLRALLGAAPGYGAALSLPATGGLTVADMTLEGPGGALRGEAAIDGAWNQVDADYSFEVADLGLLAAAIDLPLSGRVRATGKVTGALANPSLRLKVPATNLVVADIPIGGLSLDLRASEVVEAASGHLTLRATVENQSLTAASAFRVVEAQRLELSDLSLSTEQGDRISGRLAWRLGAPNLSGDVSLALPDLGRFESLLGVRVAGALEGALHLSERDAAQDATLTLAAENLALPDSGLAWRLDRASGSANVADILGTPSMELALQAAGPAGAEPGLTSLSLSGQGGLDRITLSLAAQGALDEPFDVLGEFAIDAGAEALSVRVDMARLTYGPLESSLLAPASLALADDSVTIEGLDLAVDSGRLTGAFSLEPERLRGDLRATDLSLVLLDLVPGAPALDGLLDLRLEVEGSGAEPRGSLSIDVAGLRSRDETAPDLPPGRLHATANLSEDSVSLEAELKGLVAAPLRASARLPLQLSLSPFAAALPAQEAIDARLSWVGNSAELVTLFALDGVDLQGDIEADLTLAGTLAAPIVGGALTLGQGRYEDFVLGTRLEEIDLRLVPSGRLLTLQLQGRDPKQGRLSVTAEADLSSLAEPRFDAVAQLTELLVVQRDDVTATASGELRAAGTPNQVKVTGTVTTDQVDVRLVDALPPSVVELDVIDPATQPASGAVAPAPPDQDSPRLSLDLVLDLPSRVFVRGRGLDSEWAGRFLVTGNEREPVISGQLAPLRGNFDFVGKRFRLGEGAIRLAEGDDNDASLDLAASHEGDELVTTVKVNGTTSRPEISFSSQPPLPEEEILSRLLFNRNSTQLDPLQAVQLARAAATLSGSGGPGVLELARSTLGVDVLGFAPGEEGELGRLEAGRYLADGVYVGVEQGTAADSTNAAIEVEVTPNISVRTEAGANQSGKTRLQFKWDY